MVGALNAIAMESQLVCALWYSTMSDPVICGSFPKEISAMMVNTILAVVTGQIICQVVRPAFDCSPDVMLQTMLGTIKPTTAARVAPSVATPWLIPQVCVVSKIVKQLTLLILSLYQTGEQH